MQIEIDDPSQSNTITVIKENEWEQDLLQRAVQEGKIYYVWDHVVNVAVGRYGIETDVRYYQGHFVRKI